MRKKLTWKVIANLEIFPYGLYFSEAMSFTKITRDVEW